MPVLNPSVYYGFPLLLFFIDFFRGQVRHFKDYHGVTTKNVKEVAPKAKEQYAPYAPYQVWW